MIQITDLIFENADCCGIHASSTVNVGGGFEVGVHRGDNDTYSIAVYKNGGLLYRKSQQSITEVENLLNSKNLEI